MLDFTKDQLEAIESRGRDVLVSAAAGSGKTAVLVERILGRVFDEKDPIDIDRILILTFTNAAAAQMREKIIEGIEKKKAASPFSGRIIRQSVLVHNASITTVHGFCLSVLRDHFEQAGLSPDFRVCDEGEEKLLRQDVLDSVLEEAYIEGRQEFLDMTEIFSSGKSDRLIENQVNRLYELSMSYSEPDKWLQSCIGNYVVPDSEEKLSDLMVIKWLFEDLVAELKDIETSLENLLDKVLSVDGLYIYENTIRSDLEQVRGLAGVKNFSDLRERLSEVEFIKFGTGGKKVKDRPVAAAADKDSLKAERDALKKSIASMKESFSKDAVKGESLLLINGCVPAVKELLALTVRFREAYSLKKRKENLIDFSDMEHFTIQILSEKNGEIAEGYRRLYEEVYVDEYQDTNLVQETILKNVSRGDNLFMVGDVKQSIYGFRLARPDIFIKKYESFKKDESMGKTIELSENFRSRREVLDSVNEIFFEIMRKGNAGIDYTDRESLKPGALFYEKEEFRTDNTGTELILVERGDSGADPKELEAKAVAQKINDLMSQHMVVDSSDNTLRPLKYKDIVILLRTSKGWDESFKRSLTEEGIPVMLSARTGYFEAYEVALLLDYLKVIDNPRQDIPLASVLRGFFGEMSDDELAVIRADCGNKKEGENNLTDEKKEDETLYDSLLRAGEGGDVKARRFLKELHKYRKESGYYSVYELLKEIIDGEYGLYVLSENDGKRRYENLRMLLKKAEDFGKISYKGLFQFVRYIDMLKKYEIDYGEADSSWQGEDAVRIMTIHKSKGLEFPVCFLSGISKNYNFTDQRNAVVTDIDYGIGVDFVDPEKRTRRRTLIKDAIVRKNLKEVRAEEIRLLYVAMTRAKEKLILTGEVKDTTREFEKPLGLKETNSFLELVLYAFRRKELKYTEVKTLKAEDIMMTGVRDELSKSEALHVLKVLSSDKNTDIPLDEELSQRIEGKLKFSYSGGKDGEGIRKYTVTELKQRHIEESINAAEGLQREAEELVLPPEDFKSHIPSFMIKEKKIEANLYGSAIHRLFELWDYSSEPSLTGVKNFIDNMVNLGRIEADTASFADPGEILSFLKSPLGGRMKKSDGLGKLYREQPFLIKIDGQLVQGIIDAFFIEDGEIIVVDYKTDRVKDEGILVKRYELQLDYYSRALNTLLMLPVKERLIYSTYLKKTVKV